MKVIGEFAARIRRSAFPKTDAFPRVALQGKRVLDVGCGLNVLAVRGATTVAVDAFVDPGSEFRFVRGSMEALPFADAWFDFVSSRVALNYSHMPTTLLEMRRVLKPGGMVWGTLIARPEASARMLSSLVRMRLTDVFFVFYCMLNGWLSAAFGKQIRWINPKRCESVNTCASINRLLRGAGFRDISSEYDDRRIVFRATKPLPVKTLTSSEIYVHGAPSRSDSENKNTAKSSAIFKDDMRVRRKFAEDEGDFAGEKGREDGDASGDDLADVDRRIDLQRW